MTVNYSTKKNLLLNLYSETQLPVILWTKSILMASSSDEVIFIKEDIPLKPTVTNIIDLTVDENSDSDFTHISETQNSITNPDADLDETLSLHSNTSSSEQSGKKITQPHVKYPKLMSVVYNTKYNT